MILLGFSRSSPPRLFPDPFTPCPRYRLRQTPQPPLPPTYRRRRRRRSALIKGLRYPFSATSRVTAKSFVFN